MCFVTKSKLNKKKFVDIYVVNPGNTYKYLLSTCNALRSYIFFFSWYIVLTRSVTAGCPVVTGRQKVCIYLNLFYEQEILRRADKLKNKKDKRRIYS